MTDEASTPRRPKRTLVEGEMAKIIDTTKIPPHGLFYMENAGGTHSAIPSAAPIADERQRSCFALEEELGANWKGCGATEPTINETRPSL